MWTGGYRLLGSGKVGFTVGHYNPEHALIIDPVLSYSSFFGGNNGDMALSVKVDANGFIYVAGETLSSQFPMPLPPGGFQEDFGGGKINGDAFVAKFDPNGFGLVYFTYLGGRETKARWTWRWTQRDRHALRDSPIPETSRPGRHYSRGSEETRQGTGLTIPTLSWLN